VVPTVTAFAAFVVPAASSSALIRNSRDACTDSQVRKVVLVRQPGSPENLGPMTARKAASEHLGDEVLILCPNPEPRPGRERAC
jgi:hypothetical protein